MTRISIATQPYKQMNNDAPFYGISSSKIDYNYYRVIFNP